MMMVVIATTHYSSYFHQAEDFLAGLARGATRSALAAELAEAAQAGNAPGVLEAPRRESKVLLQVLGVRVTD